MITEEGFNDTPNRWSAIASTRLESRQPATIARGCAFDCDVDVLELMPKASITKSTDTKRHHRRVIEWFGRATECRDRLLDVLKDGVDAFGASRLENVLQSFGAEHFVALVFGLDQTIGIEKEQVARRELDPSFGVAVPGIERDRHAGRPERRRPGCAMQDELWVVSGIDVSKQPAVGVQNGEEQRQIHAAGGVLIELAIQAVGQGSQVGLVRQPCTERGLDV